MTPLSKNLQKKLANSICDKNNFSKKNIGDTFTHAENLVKEKCGNIKKSLHDKWMYRGLVLKNDMKVVLISDPSIEKSAAALNVSVGYMSDPDELPGLAHICEHMLFRGSTKYPDTEEFNKFLSLHDGNSYAETSLDNTIYSFDITSDHFQESLDRFAQWFISPLFDPTAMESELCAINAEYTKNLTIDSYRISQLIASSAISTHPYSKFGTGNKNTLKKIPNKIDLRKELLNFYNQWYSSSIMSLCVLGNESLNELEEIVVNLFTKVKNNQINAPEWPEHPFNEHQFQHKWYIVGIEKFGTLTVIFPIPDLRVDYRKGIEFYISYLLNHKGNGSLLSVLKKVGWCNCCCASLSNRVARGGCNFLDIKFGITDKGMKHIDDIITHIFQYLNMLRKLEPVEWLFRECQKIRQMQFDFQEQSDESQNYINQIALRLGYYSMEDVLYDVPTEWSPELINTVMSYLIPQNIRVYIVGKNFENTATETEFWYGTKYLKEKISEDVIDKWCNLGFNEEFKFPTPNKYIPTAFELKVSRNSDIKNYPVIIKDNPIMRIWYKQDDEFFMPKIYLKLYFRHSQTTVDPMNNNLVLLYQALATDLLNENTYDIKMAGFNWSIDTTDYGIVLNVNGYSSKFLSILEEILDKMINLSIDPQRFEIEKENYIKLLHSFETDVPHNSVFNYCQMFLYDHVWSIAERLEASKYLYVERLERFISEFFSKLHVEGLIYGNIVESEVWELGRLINQKLTEKCGRKNKKRNIVPLAYKNLSLHRTVCLEKGKFFYEVCQKYHKESASVVYYQCEQSMESLMLSKLLTYIIKTPCYNCLREQQKLGYVVLTFSTEQFRLPGLAVIVQSSKSSRYIERKIVTCIDSMLDLISSFTDGEFDQYKTSLALHLLEKPKSMTSLSNYYWDEICMQQYNFDRANVEINYLKAVTKNQLIQFFKVNDQIMEYINEKAPMKRRLTVHLISSVSNPNNNDDEKQKIDQTLAKNDICDDSLEIIDIQQFKANQSLFPLLTSFKDIPQKCKPNL